MAKGAGKQVGNVLVWLVLIALVVGLGGYGVTNFGGSTSSVATVGDRDISAQDYARNLRQSVQAQGQQLTLAEASQRGIPAQVQGRLIANAALDNEADRIGLSVGDERVADQIAQIESFQGLDGDFSSDAYTFALQQTGFTTSEFEADIRDETARSILQASVAGGVDAPARLIDVLMQFYGERRSFEFARYTAESLIEPLPEPSDEELQAYYDENSDDFTIPAAKLVSYAWLTPDMLAPQIEVDEDALRQIYDERSDEFTQAERRLVERLIFDNEDQASEARAAIENGDLSFEDVVEGRGLGMDDVDLGDVAESDLGAAGAEVFALEEPGLVGPLPSQFGPALYRMNGILAATTVTFEEARDDLARDLRLERARRQIEALAIDAEDALAGGATVEDLAAETPLEAGRGEIREGSEDPLASYTEVREAARSLTAEDYASIDVLEDGGIYAMRLDEELPPRVPPLADVKPQVIAGWERAATRDLLREEAERAVAQLDVGGQFGDDGSETGSADLVTRDTFIADTPEAMIEAAFEMEEGDTRIVEGETDVFLLRVTAIAPPAEDDERMTNFRNALTAQTAQSLAADVYQLYGRALTDSAGISYNDAAINAVNSQLFR
ncbi:SurA N-terminal domain-containing protein [Roseicyclus sp. F158]|uniref:SurA N-terminal domain-containing protein n=1 Tax=Tropicimonas omnivorans TaxID=3075590 RepID=A0ABU3DJ32_9RHOB|nr:peptidyl-prolyl cis-trans isomerase [Roseicyclus sp. F158]MDT0683737.1 SurA N-terminal domain-containing protein [Roseicyclus sp. F158]